MNKCEGCLRSRPIVSENGIHNACCLSQKAALNCMLGKKDRKIFLRGGVIMENVEIKSGPKPWDELTPEEIVALNAEIILNESPDKQETI